MRDLKSEKRFLRKLMAIETVHFSFVAVVGFALVSTLLIVCIELLYQSWCYCSEHTLTLFAYVEHTGRLSGQGQAVAPTDSLFEERSNH